MGQINIANEKKRVLKRLADQYDDLTFFDDNPENIKLAQEVGKIRTRLVDSMNI
jgi:ribosomal protein S17E